MYEYSRFQVQEGEGKIDQSRCMHGAHKSSKEIRIRQNKTSNPIELVLGGTRDQFDPSRKSEWTEANN